jgi:hypothetical protein
LFGDGHDLADGGYPLRSRAHALEPRSTSRRTDSRTSRARPPVVRESCTAAAAAVDSVSHFLRIRCSSQKREARPGHEMQFASLVERGVSTARAIYAFNSINVDGWREYRHRLYSWLQRRGNLT